MDDQPTCGKGLAEHSVLPATLARLMAATAAILENHQKALVLDDENARREYAAYVKLAEAYRGLGEQLRAAADQMGGYRDLPMGKHDERAMTSLTSVEVFGQFVKAEREVLTLLERAVDRDERMLHDMQNVSR